MNVIRSSEECQELKTALLFQSGALESFITTFTETYETLCPRDITPRLHMLEVPYHGKPTWAQNDAMMRAYLDGMDYMYRSVQLCSVVTFLD